MITIKNPGKNLQGVKPLVLEVWQRVVVFAVERVKLLNIKTINVLTLHFEKPPPVRPHTPVYVRREVRITFLVMSEF